MNFLKKMKNEFRKDSKNYELIVNSPKFRIRGIQQE